MELRDYFLVIRRNLALILTMTLLGLGVGVLLSVVMPTKYESYTQLYVSVRLGGENASDLSEGATYSRQVVNSYVDVITRGVVLEPVIEELGLDTTSGDLADQVTASTLSDSALINITATSEDAEGAARLADAVGQSLQEVVRTQLEPELATGDSPVTLTTTQQALVPEEPISPNIPANILFGVLLGLIIGIAIAILRSVFDNRVHDMEDIEPITDKPVLGTIAHDPKSKSQPLIDLDRSQSRRAESYRGLRTNLQFINVSAPHQILSITSANPSEGKTTTALNLALTIAKAGARVVAVEGDLRSPSFARYLDIEGGAGLSDVLIGLADVDDVLQQWGKEEFFVLPAGRVPPNPSELLGSERMSQVLEELGESHDYVIVDAPPVLSVTDAAVVGKQTGGVLMIIAVGSTTKRDLQRSLQTLDTAGVNVFGVVATKLPAKGPQGYRYGTYGAPA